MSTQLFKECVFSIVDSWSNLFHTNWFLIFIIVTKFYEIWNVHILVLICLPFLFSCWINVWLVLLPVAHIFSLFVIFVLLNLLFFSNFRYWDKWNNFLPISILKDFNLGVSLLENVFPSPIWCEYYSCSSVSFWFLKENNSIRNILVASLYA